MENKKQRQGVCFLLSVTLFSLSPPRRAQNIKVIKTSSHLDVVLVHRRVEVPLLEQEAHGVTHERLGHAARERSDDVVDRGALGASPESSDLRLGLPLRARQAVGPDRIRVPAGGVLSLGSGGGRSGSTAGGIRGDRRRSSAGGPRQVRMLQHALRQVVRDLVVVRDGPDVEGHERARAVERAQVAVDADVGSGLPGGTARGGAVVAGRAALVVVVAPVLDRDDAGAVVDAKDGGGRVLGGVEDLADEGQLRWGGVKF